MLVGVPKEIKAQEHRVGLTPTSVRELVHNGHQVVVETAAGLGIGFSDEHYQAAGATIVAVNPLREAGLLNFANPQKARGVVGRGTDLADEFLQVRLGGDQALFQALAAILVALALFGWASWRDPLALRAEAGRRFAVELGRLHRTPVGPHPRWSCQLAFAPELFAEIVPWLALNRGPLVVFIHPNTGQPVEDHRDRAIWLGTGLELDLEPLRRAAEG
mgnify:CR=1 FL=1